MYCQAAPEYVICSLLQRATCCNGHMDSAATSTTPHDSTAQHSRQIGQNITCQLSVHGERCCLHSSRTDPLLQIASAPTDLNCSCMFWIHFQHTIQGTYSYVQEAHFFQQSLQDKRTFGRGVLNLTTNGVSAPQHR